MAVKQLRTIEAVVGPPDMPLLGERGNSDGMSRASMRAMRLSARDGDAERGR